MNWQKAKQIYVDLKKPLVVAVQQKKIAIQNLQYSQDEGYNKVGDGLPIAMAHEWHIGMAFIFPDAVKL